MEETLRVPFEYISDYLSLISKIDVENYPKLTRAKTQRIGKYFQQSVKIYFSDYIKSQCIMKLGTTVRSKSMSTASKAYLYLTGEVVSNRYKNCLIDMISSYNQDMRALYTLLDEYKKNKGIEGVDFKIGVISPTEDTFHFTEVDEGIKVGEFIIRTKVVTLDNVRKELNKAEDDELFEVI